MTIDFGSVVVTPWKNIINNYLNQLKERILVVLRIASTASDDITNSCCILTLSIFKRLSERFSIKKNDINKCYSRCQMEPLPNEIYQDIVDFQSDVNRPIDISIYREFLKEAAWAPNLIFLVFFIWFHYSIYRYKFYNFVFLLSKAY